MKKILKVLLLALTVFAIGGIVTEVRALAPEEGEATVIVHFHKWDEDYTGVGAHSWGKNASVVPIEGTLTRITEESVLPTGQDEFGLVFEFFVTAGAAKDLGFIPVIAESSDPEAGTIVPNWGKKLSDNADVMIPVADLAEGDVLEVWVFEGTKGNKADAEKGEVPYLVSKTSFDIEGVATDAHNMLLVYADVAGEYEENLGIHAWNVGDYDPALGIAGAWGTPDKVFNVVGINGTSNVLAAMVPFKVGGDPGMLIYAGGDENKHTGDIKPATVVAADAPAGTVGLVYVLNAGSGVTHNDNVFFGENLVNFYSELMAFRFDKGSYAQGKGTFAYNPTTIYTLLNRVMNFGWANARTDEEKAAIEAEILACFTVEEITVDDEGNETVVKEVPVEAVNFDRTKGEVSEFILELAEENKLDNTKQYRVRFNRDIQNNADAIAEVVAHNERVAYGHEVTVSLTVTLGELLDSADHIYLVGSVNGWNPGDPTWKLVQDSVDTTKFTLNKTFYTYDKEMQFKFVAGDDWPFAESDADGNEIPNRVLDLDGANVEATLEIVNFNSISNTASTKPKGELPAEDPEMVELPVPEATYDELAASERLEMDTEAPVITFLTEWDEDEGRVIYIELGSSWNQALFPTYTVSDNRDGDIGYKVYVPNADEGNEFRVLDTRVAGDYKILLKVVDDWGNITEELFTFRVK